MIRIRRVQTTGNRELVVHALKSLDVSRIGVLGALVGVVLGSALSTARADEVLVGGTFIDRVGVSDAGTFIAAPGGACDIPTGCSMRYAPGGGAQRSEDLYSLGVKALEFFVVEGQAGGVEFQAANDSQRRIQSGGVEQNALNQAGRSIVWEGQYTLEGGGAAFDLTQEWTAPQEACFVRLRMTLQATQALQDVYIFRAGDPDSSDTTSDTEDPDRGFRTNNQVLSQWPGADSTFVSSALVDGPVAAAVGMGSYDPRSRAVIGTEVENTFPKASEVWNEPPQRLGARDELVGLVFDLGDIPVGETRTIEIFYAWGDDQGEANRCFLESFCVSQQAEEGDICDSDDLFCSVDRCDAAAGTVDGQCVATADDRCTVPGACSDAGVCDEDNDVCVRDIDDGFCVIDNQCIAEGDFRSNDPSTCEVCDPGNRVNGWTPVFDTDACPEEPVVIVDPEDPGNPEDPENPPLNEDLKLTGDSAFCQVGTANPGVWTSLMLMLMAMLSVFRRPPNT